MQSAESCFRTESFQICASKTGSSLGERLQNGGIGSGDPGFRVDFEDLQTRFEVGEIEKHLAIESSGASKRWIDGIDAIGGSDHDDLATRVQSVHQREQRGDNRRMDLVLLGRARRRQSVDLIEEDNGRLIHARLLEEQTKLPFRFADPFAQTIRAFPHEERNLLSALRVTTMNGGNDRAAVAQRASDERFAGTRRADEENATRRGNVELLEDFGVEERQHDHFFEGCDVLFEASNGVPRDRCVDADRRRVGFQQIAFGGFRVERLDHIDEFFASAFLGVSEGGFIRRRRRRGRR